MLPVIRAFSGIFAAFVLAGATPAVHAADCNRNSIDDTVDVTGGASADCNRNGVPDECEYPPLEFGAREDAFPVGALPLLVATGDFNGDGRADVVTGNQSESNLSSVSVLLNQGDGGFEPAVKYDAGTGLRALTAADLDGDGDLDLATANSDQVLLFMNRGDGSFGAAAGLFVPAGTRFVAAGDVTGDGAEDLVTTNITQGTVSVLANLGRGVIASPRAFAAGGSPTSVVLGDFDGDGDLDLAVSNRGSRNIAILLNTGEGAFPQAVDYEIVGEAPVLVKAGDLDGDGDLDLAATTFGTVEVLMNRGNGLFSAAVAYDVFSSSIEIADLNSDGSLDLILSRSGAPPERKAFSVLVNLGGGRFAESENFPLDFPPRAAAAGDFDLDGDLDLALSGLETGTVSVLWNSERLNLAIGIATVPMGLEPHAAAMGDVNGDGYPDVVTANGGFGSVSVLLSDGGGSVRAPVHYPVRDAGHLGSIALGDLDGDGDLDAVAADLAASRLRVLFNDGAGALGNLLSYDTGDSLSMVTTGDVDGDAHLDLIAANGGSSTITLRLNNGSAMFNRRQDLAVGASPVAVAASDLDRDGDLDLVTANLNGLSLSMVVNQGGGAFARAVSLPLSWPPLFVVAGDFDGDGSPDLAAAGGSAAEIAVLMNKGNGTFAAPATFAARQDPSSLTVTEVDGDGFLDLVSANQELSSASLFLGGGDGSFHAVAHHQVGLDPRIVLAGDIDLDGDTDLVSANHTSLDLTILRNFTGGLRFEGDYAETICTGLDFYKLSAPSRGGSRVDRTAKYVLPATDNPALLPVLFQNVRRYPLHLDFLARVFSDRFPGLTLEEYNRLTGRRASRQYFVGVISRLSRPGAKVYGFNALVDGTDPVEQLTLDDVRGIYERLRLSFRLEPLGYLPDGEQARETAAAWVNPGFPIYLDEGSPTVTYQPYTRAVGYGRVFLLSAGELEAAGAGGQISFQSVLVLERAPRDIEGVVGGVITAELQGELSHLAVRTARRNTPNAFVADALARFRPFEGKLVRLEVAEAEYRVAEATLAEAEAFWAASRPRLSAVPELDPEFAELSSLVEMDLTGGGAPEMRFGGKASNLARLQQLLAGGPFDRYREDGFAIPVRYSLEFLRGNRIPSALDPRRLVTYQEHLFELFGSPEFRSDPAARFAALGRFRDYARDNGIVDPALLARLRGRIAEVFASTANMVRFRSSSNVEDALEFNGAGLYESTSACAADDLDANDNGPSRCDPAQGEERGLARALKKVWTSLYTFRAYEERAYYGIPEDRVAMAILVSRAFLDEEANGVAFTGNISNPLDRRYVVVAQVGEESVVSPPPGVESEKDLLEIAAGRVARIIRPARGSSLAPPGTWVLSDSRLEELGSLMAYVDRGLVIDLGAHQREEVLLDFEFKIENGASLAIKQVRPFLQSGPVPPAPAFELEIPPGTVACGVFGLAGDGRGPREEYELKSTVRFRGGTIPLPTRSETFTEDLFEEVRFGPGRDVAVPVEPGLFRVQRAPGCGQITAYRFTYEQEFSLPGGRSLRLEVGSPFVFRGRGERALDGPAVLDEEFFTRRPGTEALAAQLDGVPLVRYGSCSYETLPFWNVDAQLEDGSSLHLEERFLPVPVSDAVPTGPASLVRAEVNLGGTRRVVSDYWSLVYSAFRHNQRPRYWVVLTPPVAVPGIEAPVHAVELVAPETRGGADIAAQAKYLGPDFQVLRSVEVGAYGRARVEEPPASPFRRGDVNADGAANLTDAVVLLNYLFLNGPLPACLKSADTNDNGATDLTDSVYLVNYLFLEGPAPPPPSDACGPDPSRDALSCGGQPSCP